MVGTARPTGNVRPMGDVDPVLTSPGYLLLKAGTHFHAIIDEALAALDLTGRSYLVLTFAGGPEPLSQSELSARLGIDPTIVVGLIDGLEARGAIRRERDPADRRRSLLMLTAAGRKLHTKASTAVATAERDFLGPLSGADRKELRALLIEVMQHRLPWMAPTEP
jgi:DNA-binding MarR family transcriptional regulator